MYKHSKSCTSLQSKSNMSFKHLDTWMNFCFVSDGLIFCCICLQIQLHRRIILWKNRDYRDLHTISLFLFVSPSFPASLFLYVYPSSSVSLVSYHCSIYTITSTVWSDLGICKITSQWQPPERRKTCIVASGTDIFYLKV